MVKNKIKLLPSSAQIFKQIVKIKMKWPPSIAPKFIKNLFQFSPLMKIKLTFKYHYNKITTINNMLTRQFYIKHIYTYIFPLCKFNFSKFLNSNLFKFFNLHYHKLQCLFIIINQFKNIYKKPKIYLWYGALHLRE